MRTLLVAVVVLCLFQACTLGKRHRKKSASFEVDLRDAMLHDDALLPVEPFPPDFVVGDCACKCCSDPVPERKSFVCCI